MGYGFELELTVLLVIGLSGFWAYGANTLINNFEQVLAEEDRLTRFLVYCVLIIGTPFFFIVELLEYILDVILGDGWDSDS